MSDRIEHVYPTFGREHNVTHYFDGPPCWCDPEIVVLCQQCNGSDEGCWNCDRGLTPMIFDDGEPMLIIHKPEQSNAS